MTNLMEVTQITLPAGYTMRPAVMADIENALALFNACSMAQFGKEEFALDELQSEWTNPEFHLDTATRVVFSPAGEMVGYIEIWDTHAVPVHPWTWARVHPAHTGKGIGTFMRHWVEKRAYEVLDRVPADARVSYRAMAHNDEVKTAALYDSLGLTPMRHSWIMKIDLTTEPPAPVFPAGISLRTYRHPQDLEAVYRAVDTSFSDHFGHVDQPFEVGMKQFQHFIESDDQFDESLWFLAVDDATGKIAAVSLCHASGFNDPEMGWVGTLGVLRDYRKMGLGLAVLQHSFGEFWRRGKKSVGLGVDASSLTGATRLYQKAGMYVYRQSTLYEKELRPGVELSTTSVEV